MTMSVADIYIPYIILKQKEVPSKHKMTNSKS